VRDGKLFIVRVPVDGVGKGIWTSKLCNVYFTVLKREVSSRQRELHRILSRALSIAEELRRMHHELTSELSEFRVLTYLPGKCKYVKN
jgi:hypothetical protein